MILGGKIIMLMYTYKYMYISLNELNYKSIAKEPLIHPFICPFSNVFIHLLINAYFYNSRPTLSAFDYEHENYISLHNKQTKVKRSLPGNGMVCITTNYREYIVAM